MDTKSPIWKPSLGRVKESSLFTFTQVVKRKGYVDSDSFNDLHDWSIKNPADFWSELVDFVDVKFDFPPKSVLSSEANKGAFFGTHWFSGAKLNYARNLLHQRHDDDLCLISVSESKGLDSPKYMNYRELYTSVAKIIKALKNLGVESGDRVAAIVSNTHEAVVSMLATTALGAIWSSCSPDFGEGAIIERFQQIEPKLLISVDSYMYGGKSFDCKPKWDQCLRELPTVQSLLIIDHSGHGATFHSSKYQVLIYDEILSGDDQSVHEIEFMPLSFEHPLFILFSSGTTGRPKCITHSVGGTLVQHLKELVLHTDLKPGDRFLYYTTCGWMMWNWLVSGLAAGAVPILYDGNPMSPAPEQLWKFVSEHRVNIFGTSPKYLAACEHLELKPGARFDLSALKTLLSTGAPLLDEQYEWVYSQVKSDLHLASISGGTDIISCFMLGAPTLPVYRGQIQALGLGMSVECWDESAEPQVVGLKGELVCTKPFPSQPIGFWGDSDQHSKYKSAYFEHYQDKLVWRHGDYIAFTPEGGIKVFGRSDATLNYGGIRIGTAEIYRQIELLPYIEDSIVVERDIGTVQGMTLFVVLRERTIWKEEFVRSIKDHIKLKLSPRHVPKLVFPVAEIPYTRSGKKSELAAKEAYNQRQVSNLSALSNPRCLEEYKQLGGTLN